jgi:hypothetical protein
MTAERGAMGQAASRLRHAVLAALLFVAAAPVMAGALEGRCSGVISGAVHGKFKCTAGIEVTDEGKLVFTITPTEAIPDVPSYAPGSFELPQPLSRGVLDLQSLGFGKASVAAPGGTLYVASKTSSSRGEVTLTLDQAKEAPAGSGKYVLRGSYRARLVPAASPKQESVIIEVQFQGR